MKQTAFHNPMIRMIAYYFFPIAFCFLPTAYLFSQVPQGLNYQSVARDASGNGQQSVITDQQSVITSLEGHLAKLESAVSNRTSNK